MDDLLRSTGGRRFDHITVIAAVNLVGRVADREETAFATVELAVESMRCGAFDSITQPFVPEISALPPRCAPSSTRDYCVRTEGCAMPLCASRGSSEIEGHSEAIARLEAKSLA
jgi:DNA-binding NtrC family response regulator